MATGDNWTKEETQKEILNMAQKALKKIKKSRKDKKYKLVKVSDHPPTYKEVELKE